MLQAKKILCCPRCGSTGTKQKHKARDIGAMTGVVFGVAGTLASALSQGAGGARSGASLGAIVCWPLGPAGSAAGAAIGSVLLGALAAGATLGVAGAELGKTIDRHLDHYICTNCGHIFGRSDVHTSRDGRVLTYSADKPIINE